MHHSNSLQIIEPSCSSCPVSKETVNPVDSCPETEEEWRQAAERKNCFQHAAQCDEPGRLEYHCLINPYINQTLEVCAYPQNIVHSKKKQLKFSKPPKKPCNVFSYMPSQTGGLTSIDPSVCLSISPSPVLLFVCPPVRLYVHKGSRLITFDFHFLSIT